MRRITEKLIREIESYYDPTKTAAEKEEAAREALEALLKAEEEKERAVKTAKAAWTLWLARSTEAINAEREAEMLEEAND